MFTAPLPRLHIPVRILLALALVALIVFANRHERAVIAEKTELETALAELYSQLEKLPPNSEMARHLRARVGKVRWKMQQKQLDKTAAPDQFWRDLADAKKRADGTTYAPDYLQQELQKAMSAHKQGQETLNWVSRGPGNVSGRVRSIVIDAADPSGNTWFAGSVGGGIWKTIDSGTSWRHISPEITSLSTAALAQSTSNPDVLYAGTGLGFYGYLGGAYNGTGIWKSTDHGENWSRLASTANGELQRAITRILVDPRDENVVLASAVGDSTGIYRSTDGGLSWHATYTSGDIPGFQGWHVQQIVADPTNFNVLYAAVFGTGVLKSIDGGITWSASGFLEHADDSGRIELAIAPSNPQRVFASVNTSRYGQIYMSDNAGASWTLMVEDVGPPQNWFHGNGDVGGQGNFDNTLAVHPFDPDVLYVGGVDLYRIAVTGPATRRYEQLTLWFLGRPHPDHHVLLSQVTNPETQEFRLINGNDGGLSISLNGGDDWQQITGMTTTQFFSVDKQPGADVFIGGMQDNGTWMSGENQGESAPWTVIGFGDGMELVWNHHNPSLMITSSQFGNYSRTTDGGFIFQQLDLPQDGPFVSQMTQIKSNPYMLATFGNGVFRFSDDFGLNWHQVQESGWLGGSSFDDVKISQADPRIIWFSSSKGRTRGGVWISEDGGHTVRSNHATGLPSTPISVTTHPFEPNTAYLTFATAGAPKLMRTTDLGQSWQDLSQFSNGVSTAGYPDVATFCMLVLPHQPDTLWAGTEIGLVVSEDGGNRWFLANNGLPTAPVFRLEVADDQIMVATHGRGIWTLRVPELEEIASANLPIRGARISNLATHPDGKARIRIEIPSSFDKTSLLLNGAVIKEFPANQVPKTITYTLNLDGDTVGNFQVRAQLGDQEWLSLPKQSSLFQADDEITELSLNFNSADDSNYFVGTGFSVSTDPDFADGSLHTPHPYEVTTPYVFQLRSPLRLGPGATMSFDEVALVETGGFGTEFGDPQFWDYAIVEASTNGFDWRPLLDGYDASDNSDWNNAYAFGQAGTAGLYVHREINLLDRFKPGDLVFLRFRLESDPGTVGWGWAIDNLEISAGVPTELGRQLLYPWVSYNETFQSLLVIDNHELTPAEVNLVARRADGTEALAGPFTIEPEGFLAEPVIELFPDLGEGDGFTVVAAANVQNITGRWVTNNLNGAGPSPSQGVAADITQLDEDNRVGKQILFGYLPSGDGMISAPVVVNTGTETTNVELAFYDADGQQLVATPGQIINLEPFKPFAMLTSEFLPELNGAASLVATSTENITGVAFVFNNDGEAAIGNVDSIDPVETGQGDLLFPWISANDTYESLLVVNNLSEAPIEASLTATRADGSQAAAQRTVPANGFVAESALTLFPGLSGESGMSVRLNTQQGAIRGRWVTTNKLTPSGSSPAQGVAASLLASHTTNGRLGTSLSFGYLPLDGNEFAAPVLVNTGEEETNVSLYFYNRAGELLLTDHVTLFRMQPGRPYANLARNWLPHVNEEVYLVAVSSSQPITGVTFVFNEQGEPAIGNAVNPR